MRGKKKGGVKKRRFEDIYHLNNLNKKSRSGLIYLKENIFFFCPEIRLINFINIYYNWKLFFILVFNCSLVFISTRTINYTCSTIKEFVSIVHTISCIYKHNFNFNRSTLISIYSSYYL